MNDKDIKYNGSGYPDPTAYKSMKNVLEGETLQRGEIWSTDDGKGGEQLVVVIQDHGKVCSVLLLFEKHVDGCFKVVIDDDSKYYEINPSLLTYKYKNKMFERRDVLNTEDIERLVTACAERLQLSEFRELTVTESEQAEEIKELRGLFNAQETLLDQKAAEIKALRLRVDELGTEKANLMDMYDNLVERLDGKTRDEAEIALKLARAEAERDLYRDEFKALQAEILKR